MGVSLDAVKEIAKTDRQGESNVMLAVVTAGAWALFGIAAIASATRMLKRDWHKATFLVHLLTWCVFFSFAALFFWPLGAPLPPIPIGIFAAVVVSCSAAERNSVAFARTLALMVFITLACISVLAKLVS